MSIPRRKKLFTMDGAEFLIAPLTYDELDEYGERLKTTREKVLDLNLPAEAEPEQIPKHLRDEMRANAFYLVCCGMNNAIPEVVEQKEKLQDGQIDQAAYDAAVKPFEITPRKLAKQMDDVTASILTTKILELNGVRSLSIVEYQQRKNKSNEGETLASS